MGVKVDHQRANPTAGNVTNITSSVRKEIDRRVRAKFNSNIAMCERCGRIHNLSAAHIVFASQMGSGSDPANVLLLCGTHGWTDTCHHWTDNTPEGREWLSNMGKRLKGYYEERERLKNEGGNPNEITYY